MSYCFLLSHNYVLLYHSIFLNRAHLKVLNRSSSFRQLFSTGTLQSCGKFGSNNQTVVPCFSTKSAHNRGKVRWPFKIQKPGRWPGFIGDYIFSHAGGSVSLFSSRAPAKVCHAKFCGVKEEWRNGMRKAQPNGWAFWMECSPFRRGDPWENRTPVCGVRGRRLDRLTNGPHLTASSLYPGPRGLSTHFQNFFEVFWNFFFQPLALLYIIHYKSAALPCCGGQHKGGARLPQRRHTLQHFYYSTKRQSFSIQQLYK